MIQAQRCAEAASGRCASRIAANELLQHMMRSRH
jgi:hypothetical protein